ncbi:patatin-like phospholipase family protein [Oceanibacterium hippocampi]|uniref:NTE family protein RssA n=1 Tax=Oceanibacterium hippocampi TaxID=745714 RepID=A0A1Y5TPA9_9PROT|nr:patatin-like phospholipase family protein [Oceanibacterium hippocampi]SLN68735.1 NTE family protein RssA [Oceanibacterium hippocampi]
MAIPTIGLALGSGVAHGWAHIGVLERLEELGIKPDVVAGTSIGALVGGVYLAGELDTLKKWALSLSRSGMLRYFDLQFSGGGLIGGRRLAKLLNESLGDKPFEKLGKPFIAIATELATGHEIWIRRGDLVQAITASYALPGFFPPVQVDGRWLVDGALTNPVPVSVCRALGARLVIAVNLNADFFGRSSHAARESTLTDWQSASMPVFTGDPVNAIRKRLFKGTGDTPSLFGVMVNALDIVQDRLSRSRLAGDPPDVVVAPRLGDFGLLDFEHAEAMMLRGRESVDRALPALNQALAVLA